MTPERLEKSSPLYQFQFDRSVLLLEAEANVRQTYVFEAEPRALAIAFVRGPKRKVQSISVLQLFLV